MRKLKLQNWSIVLPALFSLIIILLTTTCKDDDPDPTSDGDIIELSISPSTTITEGTSTEVTISSSVVNNTGADILVNYSVSGSATEGEDYEKMSGTVTIANGASSVTLTVNTTDDEAIEESETIIIDLSSTGLPTNVEIVDPSSITLTIVDNDNPDAAIELITIAVSSNSLEEGNSFNVTATSNIENNTGANLTINYTISGSAISGTDYTSLSGSFDIADGSSQADLEIQTIDDSEIEEDETIVITFTDISGITIDPEPVTLTITDNDESAGGYDLTTKAGSKAFYEDVYLANQISDNGWSGENEASCNPGGLSSGVLDKAIAQLNYFRTIVGLAGVATVTSMNSKSQKGAYVAQLQFDQGNNLSSSFHNPPDDWTCWSTDAHEAMSNGNISQGFSTLSSAMQAYMWDPGPNNTSAGHRDAMLATDLTEVGFGATNEASVLMSQESGERIGQWSWPAAGTYIPNTILYSGTSNPPRWSVRNERAFIKYKSQAANGGITPSVSIKDCNGNNVSLGTIKIANNNLLTFEVNTDTQSISDECEYTVTISDYWLVANQGDGAGSGSLTTYEYSFIIFKP